MTVSALFHLHCSLNLVPGWNFLFGYVSGSTATAVAFPLDCIRTRLVGQGEPKVWVWGGVGVVGWGGVGAVELERVARIFASWESSCQEWAIKLMI